MGDMAELYDDYGPEDWDTYDTIITHLHAAKMDAVIPTHIYLGRNQIKDLRKLAKKTGDFNMPDEGHKKLVTFTGLPVIEVVCDDHVGVGV